MLFTDDNINPKEYSPLALAYIGDTVYDLFIRTKVLAKGNRHVTEMHKESVSFVKAHSQSVSAYAIEEVLTEDELRVLKWGRNAKSNTIPKNADVTEYHMATGFETLVGYLYLSGDNERLSYLLNLAYDAVLKIEK
ncbi:MAG: Mini-ribonuclease 3 [Ruminococcaceae bacterium]|nr:Mini-ribonuclease 3 [Oscillospiraceae bacterium]